MLISVEESDWVLDTFFEKVGNALGEHNLQRVCMHDHEGKPKLVRRSQDHFAILLLWAIKIGKLIVEEC
jgi:hypothetical protein